MFSRSKTGHRHQQSHSQSQQQSRVGDDLGLSSSKHRLGKSNVSKTQKRSAKDSHGSSFATSSRRMTDKHLKASKAAIAASFNRAEASEAPSSPTGIPTNLNSPIITLVVGPDARLFAAHQSILDLSPFFADIFHRSAFVESGSKRVTIAEEVPEIFSSVLEYLYKGDYTPCLIRQNRHNQDKWHLEAPAPGSSPNSATIHVAAIGTDMLKDTLVYCAADRYGLPELKRLALRKQGLQTGITCQAILTSARYAYANTPETDNKLRAHYLALIIRSRAVFKRSRTMQVEMEHGGGAGMWFDLFVAMCNHLDDMSSVNSPTKAGSKYF